MPQGDRVRLEYDVAQTPLQRLLASGVLSEDYCSGNCMSGSSRSIHSHSVSSSMPYGMPCSAVPRDRPGASAVSP